MNMLSKGWIDDRYDGAAGLQYLNARYYDPDLAMFTQPDWWEVTEPGVGTNRYAYAGGDPVNGVDPGGHEYYTNSAQSSPLFQAIKDWFDRARSTLNQDARTISSIRTSVSNGTTQAYNMKDWTDEKKEMWGAIGISAGGSENITLGLVDEYAADIQKMISRIGEYGDGIEVDYEQNADSMGDGTSLKGGYANLNSNLITITSAAIDQPTSIGADLVLHESSHALTGRTDRYPNYSGPAVAGKIVKDTKSNDYFLYGFVGAAAAAGQIRNHNDSFVCILSGSVC